MADDAKCRAWVEALDIGRDLRPVPVSGDVEFKQNSDGHYEVDISYTGCQAGGISTKTEIRATLSKVCWTVHARISSMASGDLLSDMVLSMIKKQR